MANDSTADIVRDYRKNRQTAYLERVRAKAKETFDVSNEPGIGQVFSPVNPAGMFWKGAAGGAVAALATRNVGRGATLVGRKAMTKTPKQVRIAEFKAARQAARDSTALVPYAGTGATMTEPWLVSGTRRTVRWAGQKLARTPAAMGATARKGGHAFESVDNAMMKVGSMLFGVERNVNRNMPLTVRQSMAANLGWAATGAAAGGAVGGIMDLNAAHDRRKVEEGTEYNRKMLKGLPPEQLNDERALLHYLFNPENGAYSQYVSLVLSPEAVDTGARDRLKQNIMAVYQSPLRSGLLDKAFSEHRRTMQTDPKYFSMKSEDLDKLAVDQFYDADVDKQLEWVRRSVWRNGAGAGLGYGEPVFGGRQ